MKYPVYFLKVQLSIDLLLLSEQTKKMKYNQDMQVTPGSLY